VRPRGQIPGPRPFSYSRFAISGVVWRRRVTAGSQFRGEPSPPSGAVLTIGRCLNSVGSNRWLRGASYTGHNGQDHEAPQLRNKLECLPLFARRVLRREGGTKIEVLHVPNCRTSMTRELCSARASWSSSSKWWSKTRTAPTRRPQSPSTASTSWACRPSWVPPAAWIYPTEQSLLAALRKM
jgi:hypothetical protein